MKISYGINCQEKDDPYIKIARNVVEAISATTDTGSGYLVDTIPLRMVIFMFSWPKNFNTASPVKYLPEWFPGATFKREAKVWKGYADAMLNVPFQVMQDNIVSSVGYNTFFSDRCSRIALGKRRIDRLHCNVSATTAVP